MKNARSVSGFTRHATSGGSGEGRTRELRAAQFSKPKRQLEVLAVVALALVSMFFSLNAVFANGWSRSGNFGFGFDSSLRINDVDTPAAGDSLRIGDVVDLKSIPIDKRGYLFDSLFPPLDATITFRIIRAGVPRSVTLEARNSEAPWLDPGQIFSPVFYKYWISFWLRPLVAMLFVICGAAMVLVRPGAMTWGFYLYCLGVHPWMYEGPLEPFWLGVAVVLVAETLSALGWAGLVVFAARFPDDRAAGGWRYLERSALLVFAALLGLNLWAWSQVVTALPMPDLGLSYQIIIATLCASVFVALCVKLPYLKGPQRASLAWIIVGFGVGIIFGTYWQYIVPGFYQLILDRGHSIVQLLIKAVFPLSVAYAIIRYRALELGFFANRVLVYGFFGAAAAVLFAALEWLLTRLALSTFAISVGIALALALGMLLQTHHNRIVRLIDRFFLPKRYEAAVSLDRIRANVRRGAEASHESVTAEVAAALDLASVALFRRVDDGGFVRQASSGWGDGAVWHLLPNDELARLLNSGSKVVAMSELDSHDVTLPIAAARPLVALPVRRRGRVEGAILVGPHRNGSGVDRDEVRGLAALFNDVLAA